MHKMRCPLFGVQDVLSGYIEKVSNVPPSKWVPSKNLNKTTKVGLEVCSTFLDPISSQSIMLVLFIAVTSLIVVYTSSQGEDA